MKNTCNICTKEIGLLTTIKVSDGIVCATCVNGAGYTWEQKGTLRSRSIDSIRGDIERKNQNIGLLSDFKATKKIGTFIYFDEPKKQWLVPKGLFGDTKKSFVYNFSDIQEFELLENGGSVSSGGLGRALVGGVLFGGVGALVGGVTGKKKGIMTVTSMQIKITTRDISNPAVYIDLVHGGSTIKTNSLIYRSLFKNAQDIMSTLSTIVNGEKASQETSNQANSTQDTIAQLREYKKLLDEQIITQEEFDKKKAEILS